MNIQNAMENFWNLLLLAVSLVLVGGRILLHRRRRRLPPGPTYFPIIGSLLWLRHSIHNIEPLLRQLHRRYGPIVSLYVGSRLVIYVTDHSLAYKLLVQQAANFSDRAPSLEAVRLIGNDRLNINSTDYGEKWRILRRNLTTEILNPVRVKLYSHGRKWVLGKLVEKIKLEAAERNGVVVVKEAFQYAMFCLLVFMCFGEKLEEKKIREIEKAQRDLLSYFGKLQPFNFFPGAAKFLFSDRSKKVKAMRKRQIDVFLLLITSRREMRKKLTKQESNCFEYCYVDSLLDITIPEENKRKLTDGEIIGLCSEFLNGGTNTTLTALQWIMANLVKQQDVQAKLAAEINNTTTASKIVEEEDLPKMPYLKAVLMEGLRRHPPAHFVIPHAVKEDVVIDGGYLIPKDAAINFTVSEIGWDEKTWSEPMEFMPERFLAGGEGEGVDVAGSNKEIKMMPFGVGRRVCPGLGIAMLHLEYFVANLVKEFEWTPVDGAEIDFSEESGFSVVMKNPLRALVSSRV